MTAALLAVLLAQAAPLSREAPPTTARQLYESCALYLRDIARSRWTRPIRRAASARRPPLPSP